MQMQLIGTILPTSCDNYFSEQSMVYRIIYKILLGPNTPVVVFPGANWSFQVLTRVPYVFDKLKQKKCLEVLLLLECIYLHTVTIAVCLSPIKCQIWI